MESIVGTWVPYARQATFEETPLRGVKKNDFSTLIIAENGVGQARRKGLFGKTLDLVWQEHCDEKGVWYEIAFDDYYWVLVAEIIGDKMKALVLRPDKFGIGGSGMYFKKQR